MPIESDLIIIANSFLILIFQIQMLAANAHQSIFNIDFQSPKTFAQLASLMTLFIRILSLTSQLLLKIIHTLL